LPGVDASYLHGLPEITATSFTSIFIDHDGIDKFGLGRIHDPRPRELFIGPLVLVHKSPPATTGRLNVAISEEDIVFNETFYGYSPTSHPAADELVRYFALVLGSKLAIWMALITSGEFGFEREVVEKSALDRMPLPDFDQLERSRRREVITIFDSLRSGVTAWEEADEWVGQLYGLGPRDLQVISDTLEFSLPFAENKRKAQESPSAPEIKRFRDVLAKELSPWCEHFGSSIVVQDISQSALSPWHGIELRTANSGQFEAIHSQEWQGLLRAADEAAASELLVRHGRNRILMARLAQRRYWSDTQARLLAQRIIWSHLDLLKEHAEA
jgi:hypothetical protein